MKLVSFNVNSVRQRLHQLQAVINKHQPEVIGLQETKVQDHEFPLEDIRAMGYEAIYMGQKTHYGVALLTRQQSQQPVYGFPTDDESAQKRFIGAELNCNGRSCFIFNGYFPQGDSRDHPVKFPAKQKFYEDLNAYLRSYSMQSDAVVVMGDYNVAPQDTDIGIGDDNAKRWLKTGKASFLPEERSWFGEVTEHGMHDAYRLVHPDSDEFFSWFDYRSRGFEREPRRGLRIDHLLVSDFLKPTVVNAGIDYDIRGMEKPSDHAPTWIELDLARLV